MSLHEPYPPKKRRSERVLALLVVGGLLALAAVLYLPGLLDECALGCGLHEPISSITFPSEVAGSCTATGVVENTFSVGIGGVTGTVTTDNLGLSVTPEASTTPIFAGAAATVSSGTCYAAPSSGGWLALLIPPGGTGSNWAFYSGIGWESCVGSPTAPCTAFSSLSTPTTVSSGMTFLIISGTTVDLTGSTLSAFGTGGASVTGTVTL